MLDNRDSRTDMSSLEIGESGNLGIWRSENSEIWVPGNLGIWRSGDLDIQKCEVQKIKDIKSLKIQIRSARNVGKVWTSRKKSSWPHLGPSEALFSMDLTNSKKVKSCLFSWVGQWAPIQPVWALAAIHPVWGNR